MKNQLKNAFGGNQIFTEFYLPIADKLIWLGKSSHFQTHWQKFPTPGPGVVKLVRSNLAPDFPLFHGPSSQHALHSTDTLLTNTHLIEAFSFCFYLIVSTRWMWGSGRYLCDWPQCCCTAGMGCPHIGWSPWPRHAPTQNRLLPRLLPSFPD